MNIRTRLTLRFIGVVAFILFLSFLTIYLFFAHHRQQDFYERLSNKAGMTALLLLEVEEVDADLLRKIERNNPQTLPNERLLIISPGDTVLFGSDPTQSPLSDKKIWDQVRELGYWRSQEGTHQFTGQMFDNKGRKYVVLVGAEDIYGLKKLRFITTVLYLVFGFGIIVVSITGWVYAGRALQPIKHVIDQVREINENKLNLRLYHGNKKDEIAQLSVTFNDLLDRLERAFKSQKTFIANASHELRNPMTAISGQVEVILKQPRSTTEYQKALHHVRQEMDRLKQITNNLLFLAQAERNLPVSETEEIRLDELLWKSIAKTVPPDQNHRLHVKMDSGLDEEQKLKVRANEVLLESALNNLLDNALKYSQDKPIQITLSCRNNALELEITDQGIGIPAQDQEQIFEPFYRGHNTRTIRGHGVGLALTKRILSLHQIQIQIQSSTKKGSRVKLRFPEISA